MSLLVGVIFMDEIKLSVILPRFTMSTTLELALDSIFMQKINFGM